VSLVGILEEYWKNTGRILEEYWKNTGRYYKLITGSLTMLKVLKCLCNWY